MHDHTPATAEDALGLVLGGDGVTATKGVGLTYLRLDVGITELPHLVRQIPLVRPQDCLIQREGSPITSRRHAYLLPGSFSRGRSEVEEEEENLVSENFAF